MCPDLEMKNIIKEYFSMHNIFFFLFCGKNISTKLFHCLLIIWRISKDKKTGNDIIQTISLINYQIIWPFYDKMRLILVVKMLCDVNP